MRRLIFMSALLMLPVRSMAADLRAQLETVAGRPVTLDPRVPVPDCPEAFAIGWRSPAGTSLEARCPTTGWRIVIPVGGAGKEGGGSASPLLVRRGERVRVHAGGPGFAVGMDAIARADGRAGSLIPIENVATGARLMAELGSDGMLRLAGDFSAKLAKESVRPAVSGF